MAFFVANLMNNGQDLNELFSLYFYCMAFVQHFDCCFNIKNILILIILEPAFPPIFPDNFFPVSKLKVGGNAYAEVSNLAFFSLKWLYGTFETQSQLDVMNPKNSQTTLARHDT